MADIAALHGSEVKGVHAAEKQRAAAAIANDALKFVLSRIVPGADAFELCVLGDSYIKSESMTIFRKRDKSGEKIDKGIAMPTSISVNEVYAHYSPLDRQSSRILRKGEIVKASMAVHVDGYVAAAAYTVVCCSSNALVFGSSSNGAAAKAAEEAAAKAISSFPTPSDEYLEEQSKAKAEGEETVAAVEGPAGVVVKACWLAVQAALRKMQIGAHASDVTKVIEAVAADMGVKPMQGVLCHQLKQHVIEGSRCFPIATSSGDDKPEDFKFACDEVYSIDVVLSTGEGKGREAESKPSIFRRAVDRKYILKSQLGRAFMNVVENNSPTMPFSLREIEDERTCKVGVAEAMRHELLVPYHVMQDKAGEVTAEFKFTVQITPSGVKKVTFLPFIQEKLFKAPYIKDPELLSLLAVSLNPKKKTKQSEDTTGESNTNNKAQTKA